MILYQKFKFKKAQTNYIKWLLHVVMFTSFKLEGNSQWLYAVNLPVRLQ